VSLLFGVFAARSLRSEDRLSGDRNAFNRAFSALDEVLDARGAEETHVVTLTKSARGLRLFTRTPAGRPLHWQIVDPVAMPAALDSADHVMLNLWRESARTGFASEAQREDALAVLDRGLEILARDFVKLAQSPDLSFHTRWGRAVPVAGAPRLEWSEAGSSDGGPAGWQTEHVRGEGRFESTDEGVALMVSGYSRMTSGDADSAGGEPLLAPDAHYELLVTARFDPSDVKAQLVVRTSTRDGGARSEKATVLPGSNVIGIEPAREPRALGLELHVVGDGRFALTGVELRRVTLTVEAAER